MELILIFTAACGDKEFSSLESGSVDQSENPPGVRGPSILVLQAPKGNLSIFDELAVEYQVVAGSAPIASVECLWNGKSVKCSMDREKVVLPGAKVGGHKFEIVAKDANDLQDRKTLPWQLFDKFKKHKSAFSVNGNSNQVDVLFVVDNSPSMRDEQRNMATRIMSFIDRIKNLDWRIGIVTTDFYSQNYGNGQLLTFPNKEHFLTSKLDTNTARDHFGKTIQRTETGSSTEQGIRATNRAIQRAASPKDPIDQQHRAFFRNDASLSVVVLSDEDESEHSPVNKGSELLKLVNKTWGAAKKFQFHSIIVKPFDTACKQAAGNHAEGHFYAELTKSTNGILGSICEEDYGNQLAMIGQSVSNTQTTYNLDCQPKDLDDNGTPDVMVIEKTGGSVPNFVLNGSQIVFSKPLSIGQYSVEYFCPTK